MLTSRSWFTAGPWAALIALSLLGPGSVQAQRDDYKVAPGRESTFDVPPETKPSDLKRVTAQKNAEIRTRRSTMRDTLTDSGIAFNKEKEADFDKWYLGYEFPSLTLYTPEALKNLYDGRKRLVKEDLERASNDAARRHLLDIAFKFFKEVASDDYHPAVRYNAMLIVSELDTSARTSGGEPPVPFRAALPFMIQEYKNPAQIDAVRLAALLGINRHVQMAQAQTTQQAEAITQAELQEIRTLALDLVKTREAPAGRTQDGHDWMRRRGLEIIAWLAAGKLDQEIVDEIIARVSDSDENRGLRAEAAQSLNIVKFRPETGKPQLGSTPLEIKPKEIAASLLQFVVDVVNADVDQVDKYIKSIEEAEEIYTSAGGGFSGGRMSGMSGMGRSGMMAPTPGGGGSKMGPGSMGPGSGSNTSKMKMMAPSPGSSGGGSKMGPGSMGPGPGSSSRSGGGTAKMKAYMGSGGSGGMGSFGGEPADPFAYRLDPVYRKLRYEIGCAMLGLRGTEDWRRGDGSGGLYHAQLTGDDKEYIGRCAEKLHDLSGRLKKKTDELNSKVFTVDKLKLDELTKLAAEVVAKAKPKAGPEQKDPLSEPDPADDLLEGTKPAATTAVEPAAGKAAGKTEK